jgi:hypothetical protein
MAKNKAMANVAQTWGIAITIIICMAIVWGTLYDTMHIYLPEALAGAISGTPATWGTIMYIWDAICVLIAFSVIMAAVLHSA